MITDAPGNSCLLWFGAIPIAVAVFGMMFPHGLPLFSATIAVYIVALLASGRIVRVPIIFPYYLLLALLVLAIAATPRVYSRPKYDLITGLSIATYMVLLASTVTTTDQVRRLQERTALLVWGSGTIVAVIGLWKLYMLSRGVVLQQFVSADGTYRVGTSLQSDYNFYALGQIATFISGWYLVRTRGGMLIRAGFLGSIPLIVSNVAFSGSRRGLLMLVLVLLVFVGLWLLGVVRNRMVSIPLPERSVWQALRPIVATLFIAVFIAGLVRFLVDSVGIAQLVASTQRLQTLGNLGNVAASRTTVWEVALHEAYGYGFWASLLGNGFDYLGWIATRLSPTVTEYTPHNFLLASVLSGGAITTATVVWLVIRSGLAYLRQAALYRLFMLFAMVSFPFALTSLHLLFSFQLLLIMLLIPLIPVVDGASNVESSGVCGTRQ